MGRPRKSTINSTGKISNLAKYKKTQQEQASQSGINAFLKPPVWLINDIARYEYKRLAQALVSLSMASDLDKNALGTYANSYARYRQVVEQLKKEPLTVNGKPNPLCSLEIQYMKEMRANADKCGISLNSRLKIAEMNDKKKEASIESKFGDI